MNSAARWGAIGTMLAALVLLFLVAPQAATSFAAVILLAAVGYGIQRGKFSL